MKPIIQSIENVEPTRVDWLWPGRIASGRITLIAGDPGLGKSWLTLDIAATVSRGIDWPDGSECPARNVLLLNCEDDLGDTIRPRLELLSADLRNVFALTGIQTDTGEAQVTIDQHQVIEQAIVDTKAGLVIIDPIAGFFGIGADSNRDTYIRSVFRPIARIAETHRAAIVLVAHLNKSIDQAALYRFAGSVQLAGAARTAYYVGRDRSDHKRRLLLCVKNNIGSDNWALAYRIDPEHTFHPIQWELEPGSIVTEEISGDDLEDIVIGSRENEEVREIADWLKIKVVNPRGIPLGIIQKEIRAAGWGWQHANRAMRLALLKREHVHGEWYVVPMAADPLDGRGWTSVESI